MSRTPTSPLPVAESLPGIGCESTDAAVQPVQDRVLPGFAVQTQNLELDSRRRQKTSDAPCERASSEASTVRTTR
jgi:hypothetical protein